MSYNGSGTFNINTTGQPVVAGTVITASAFNALTTDLATGLTTAITKDGQTTTTARITFAQGITSSLVTDSSSVSTGSIITAGGAGIAKNLYVGVNANVAGTLGVTGVATFSAAPIYSSLTASSAVATDASKGLVSVTNTGTGNNVLATSPTLVTPVLGAASATSITVAAGTVSDPAITTTGDTNTGIFFPAADTIAFSEGGAESMRIDSSGNVGIGTSSPVNNGGYGGLTLNGASGSIYSMMYNGTENLRLFAGNNEASIQYGSSGVLTFVDGVSGGTERMRIDSSGNLGVGTSSPNSSFQASIAGNGTATTRVNFGDVLGFVDGSTIIIGSDGVNPTSWVSNAGYRFGSSRQGCIVAINPSGYTYEGGSGGGSRTFAVNSNGNVQNSNNSYGSLSDAKLKENITDATPKLESLMRVKIRNFNLIADEAKTKQIGVVAQELEEIFPSMIDEHIDYTFETYIREDGVADSKGIPTGTVTKEVKYSVFVPMLIKAIQELKTINDTQAETINALTARITALENA